MKESLENYKKRIATSGGNATYQKYGKEHMKKLSKMAVDKRKGQSVKAIDGNNNRETKENDSFQIGGQNVFRDSDYF